MLKDEDSVLQKSSETISDGNSVKAQKSFCPCSQVIRISVGDPCQEIPHHLELH